MMTDDVEKVSSEAIVADLLNDIKTSEKSFSVDKLAGCSQTDAVDEKRKKHHKHSHRSKKSKRDRKRSRTWSSSRSRSRSKDRSRNRSSERKKSRKKRSRSRSRSKRDKSKYKENLEKPKRDSSKTSEKKSSKDPDALEAEVNRSINGDTNCIVAIIKCEEDPEKATCLPEVKVQNGKKKDDVEDGEIEDIAYGADLYPGKSSESEEAPKLESEKLESEEAEKVEKDKDKSKKKRKEKERELKKRKRSSSRDKPDKRDRKTNRSRSRSRSKDRRTRHHSPSPIRVRREERPREERARRRSTSRDRRARSHDRTSYDRPSRWRSRSRERKDYDEYKRKRSRSREIIDKEKLLAIAKAKRTEMLSHGERDNASIEDFVTYCKKLQRRQEREKRREAGQAVSDHDSDGEVVKYKHPYAMPKEPIRINIVTATSMSLAQKAIMGPEEPAQLGASQLRIVFPVSSGAVHKENAEWIPVEKEEVPKSCSVEQKKHVALTSLEIDRCRAQGIPVAPVPVPKFLNSIVPPPVPPQFMPNAVDPFRPPTPPMLPSVLYVPSQEKMILKEPQDIPVPAPSDIGKVLKQRTEAQRKVLSTPNDFDAHRALREANEQISLWAALKSLPGEYTGTTGLRLLTADELQPHNPKFHAWVKKDQFRNALPATGGIGRKMLEKMGWRPGEGLGKDATGNLEPLVLDVKSDRKGLMAEEEMSIKQRNKAAAQSNMPVDMSTRNPVSVVMELCAKRRWDPPSFACEDSGADHMKLFTWTVGINGVAYRPMCGSKSKKEGKAVACQVALQSLGVLPRNPDLPVFM